MGWAPAAVEAAEFDRPKELIIPRVPRDQSSNCGSFVKAGIVRAFYRRARRVGIGLP
jgi:hypothetical protein